MKVICLWLCQNKRGEKMKRKNIFLMLTLLLLPTMVLASDGSASNFHIGVAIGTEAFMSIHMSAFVLLPIANIFDPDKSKKLFMKLFVSRIIILLIFDLFITPDIAILDFIAVFVGAFLIVPILASVKKVPINALYSFKQMASNPNTTNGNVISTTAVKENVILKCTKCGNILNATDKFCQNCGAAFNSNNAQVVQDISPIVRFDQNYAQSEKVILKNLLIQELNTQGENEKIFITPALNRRKNILLTFFGVATFIFTLMYFFNYSLYYCLLLELIVFLIYYLIGKRFNVLNVLTKQAIKSPNEDISNIVKTMREQKCNSSINSNLKLVMVIVAVIVLPTIYFFNPRVLYIRYSSGYSVLRYTRGIINNDSNNTVTIPETYKGKQVLSINENAFKNSNIEVINLPNGLESIKTKAFLNAKNLKKIDIPSTVREIRGNAFENCTNLKTVNLHEGLKDIRGSAFKNNVNLVNIKLPNSLEYLGASAFSNCSSLVEITIPKSVTEINGQTFEYCTSLKTVNLHDNIISIHGEVFIGDSSLVNITLPSKITEVRGSTFEGCSSLKSIVIPEGVTRIGGHAFYGCTSLSYVSIPSTVNEIGSSAFRQCYSLYNVRVPYGAVINERAFKESPTSIQRY